MKAKYAQLNKQIEIKVILIAQVVAVLELSYKSIFLYAVE